MVEGVFFFVAALALAAESAAIESRRAFAAESAVTESRLAFTMRLSGRLSVPVESLHGRPSVPVESQLPLAVLHAGAAAA